MSGPDEPDPVDLPIVGLTNNEVREFGTPLTPDKAAVQVKAIRDAFIKVLDKPAGASAWALKTVDLSLTVSTSGSIGWVTASATGSITLHFEPTP